MSSLFDVNLLQLRHHTPHERVQILQRAVVHVREMGAAELFLVRKLPVGTLVGDRPAAARTDAWRSSQRHHNIELRVAADLVQQRHLCHRDARRVRKLGQALPPLEVGGRDARVQERLEPGEQLAIAEDDLADADTVDLAVLVEDFFAEPPNERAPNLVVGSQ